MLSISQELKQSQQLKLSPQQIQFQKLLQYNTLAFEQRIKEELELNPILEEEMEMREENDEPADDSSSNEETQDEGDARDDEFTMEDYMNDEDYFDDYELYAQKHSRDDSFQPQTPARESLSEHLLNQLYALFLSEELIVLGELIIGNLDDKGYLERDLKEILEDARASHDYEIKPEEAEELLKTIQTFDPVGIASRDLKECLLVQLQFSAFDPYYSHIAEEIIRDHFDDYSNKHFDSLINNLNISRETLKTVDQLIKKLNPKPGEGGDVPAELNQIIPDFIIEKVNEEYRITLNDRSLPTITINKTYLEMIQEDPDKKEKKKKKVDTDTMKFLKEKFESARWFMACIEQRRETLLKVMRAIFERQYKFFAYGPEHLRPLVYREISEEIGMDISTISRVVNGKFVQSPQGIHELRFFFSEGISTDDGNEIANKQVKFKIKELIEGEPADNPLTDDRLAEILQAEGIHVARRTVAKYREQLRIPVARLRKRI